MSITLAAEYLRRKRAIRQKMRRRYHILGNYLGQLNTRGQGVFPLCAFITYRLMELRLNEPDFLLRVVQMIRSLKRKRERSFFPPTVFYRERKESGAVEIILCCSKHLFNFTTECVCCQLGKYVLPPP